MKSYIIALSKIKGSWESGCRLKEELENFNMEAELFEGTYGNDAVGMMEEEGRQLHSWGVKGPAKEVKHKEKYDKKASMPGVKGCFYSHYRLWEKCVEVGEPIIVFEDDAHVIRPYKPVEWVDVLSLVSSHRKKMQRYVKYLENPEGEPAAMNYKQGSMPGNAGYAIKPHAAAKLVHAYKNSYLPADNAINQYVVKIQIHNYMMGKAMSRERTRGKPSLIRTKYWDDVK